jgi:hypothetical protein
VLHDRRDFARDGRDFFLILTFLKIILKITPAKKLFAPQDSFAHNGPRGAAG